MTQARPTSMTVLSILNFVLGGLSIFVSLAGLVTANAAMSNPLTSFQRGGSEIAMLMLAGAIFGLAAGVLGIVAGIGLIKVARWGWGTTLAYAIVALVGNGLSLFL